MKVFLSADLQGRNWMSKTDELRQNVCRGEILGRKYIAFGVIFTICSCFVLKNKSFQFSVFEFSRNYIKFLAIKNCSLS